MSMTTSERQALTGVDVGTRRFATARRGYDTEEVDGFLARVADHVRELEGEVHRQRATLDLLQRKVASAQETAYARVFRQLMEVMRTAEREAAQIRADATRDAQQILTRAREEAAAMVPASRQEASPKRKGGAARANGKTAEPDDLSIDIEMLWGSGQPT